MVTDAWEGVLTAAVFAGGTGGAEGTPGCWMRREERFAPSAAFVPSAAVTYGQGMVPAAAWIEARQEIGGTGVATAVELNVSGFAPGRASRRPGPPRTLRDRPGCRGRSLAARRDGRRRRRERGVAGLHRRPDGTGGAAARHGWGFRRGEASSVVIHDHPGSDGTRVACFTVPFGWVA